MDLSPPTSISPIDGRYRNKTEPLAAYFSEFALIRYRVRVEVEYFIALAELPLPNLKTFPSEKKEGLRQIYRDISLADARQIKDIEKTTNHDVKAVEYFLKNKFAELGLEASAEFVHFGLTSQDINNTAVPLSLKEAMANEVLPVLQQVQDRLKTLTDDWSDIAMLARTHGQPASPTNLGKEMAVFSQRLDEQLKLLEQVPYSAKFGGATGNFNAHMVAYPDIDWPAFADDVVNQKLGLKRSSTTTQIDHYDHLGALFDGLKRINTILLDLSRDFWFYISMDYFNQKIDQNEVGSSAMPHKVNPIDFENAEGNIGIANALFEHLAAKLPVSRLQRDLTDSTVLRNVGVPISHTMIAYRSLLKGLSKVQVNEERIHKDLEGHWSVVAEAIQTILRREGYPEPYEALKDLTRTNKAITEETVHRFIDGLDVKPEIKEELKQITPFNYTGTR
jgi:adenylosuccinate lyase